MSRWISRFPYFDGPLDRSKKRWLMSVVLGIFALHYIFGMFNLDKVVFGWFTWGRIFSIFIIFFIIWIHNQSRGY